MDPVDVLGAHRARAGRRGHRGGARARGRARAHLAGRLRVEGLEPGRRQHRHQRRRREGHPLRPHAPVGARAAGGARVAAQVLELNGALEKNNTGVDLRQLFIGSEGTLGIITEATLKLTRLPAQARRDALRRRPTSPACSRCSARRGAAPFVLAAYEFFTDRCLARVLPPPQTLRVAASPRRRTTTCCSRSSGGRRRRRSRRGCRRLFERGLVDRRHLAQHASRRRELWALREGISESLSATGLPHKNDVALPIARARGVLRRARRASSRASYPGWEMCLFGHIGDGNLHVNVMKPDDLERGRVPRAHQGRRITRSFALVQRAPRAASRPSTASACSRSTYLGYSRSPAELALMRAVKHALDPKGILNPGKIFD